MKTDQGRKWWEKVEIASLLLLYLVERITSLGEIGREGEKQRDGERVREREGGEREGKKQRESGRERERGEREKERNRERESGRERERDGNAVSQIEVSDKSVDIRKEKSRL